VEDEQNCFQLALNAADEAIAAIEGELDRLQAALTKLTSDKSVFLNTRRALLIQLGELTPEISLAPENNSKGSKNHFKGMGMAAAARRHLAEVGRAQTHAEVLEALLKGNFKTQSKHPSGSLRTAMQKRPDWFRWVKRPADRGRWELVEWPIQHNEDPMAPPTAAAAPSLTLVQ